MTAVVVTIVTAGIALAIAIGVGRALDVVAVAVFVSIVAFGGLAVATARKSARGDVSPLRCADCGGLISPNAPYCKHCGAHVLRSKGPR